MKMGDELAYCGVNCEECNIYRVMAFGEALRPETVQSWQETAREHWRIDSLDAKQLNCRGCRYEGADVFYGFKLCPIRNCCKTRGLSSCGLCPEWKTCEWLDGPGGKENLERTAAME